MKYSKIKVNDKISEVQYYSVVKIQGDKVQLQNEKLQMIVVDKGYVESCLVSADQFDETKSINKTEAASLLLGSVNQVITVNFNKQVKEIDVVKEIMNAYEGSTPKAMESAVKKAVKNALEGEERTMRGYHTNNVNEFGRLSFIDMDVERTGKGFDSRIRQVDPRNINFIISKGTKYVVK